MLFTESPFYVLIDMLRICVYICTNMYFINILYYIYIFKYHMSGEGKCDRKY